MKKSGLVFILLFIVSAAAVSANVIINEILPHAAADWDGDTITNPSTDPNTDEWVELYNNGTSSVNIGGWNLSSGTIIKTIPTGTTLAANGYYVVYGTNTTLGLSNNPAGGLAVTLYNSSGSFIEQYVYISDPGIDVSFARGIGNTNWFVWNFSAPTPNAANTENVTPQFSSPSITLNSYNYTAANQNITASVNATDNIAVSSVRCDIRNIANTATAFSGTTKSGNTYTCTGLQAPTQDDYQITFTATDTSNNTNTTAPINFTTKLTTQGQLNVPSITITNMTSSAAEVRQIAATLTNTGVGAMHNPQIFIQNPSSIPSYLTFAQTAVSCGAGTLQVGQTCQANFTVTVSAGTYTPGTSLLWGANWTDNNNTSVNPSSYLQRSISVPANPVINAPNPINSQTNPGATTLGTIGIVSDGNVDLNNVQVSFVQNTMAQSWFGTQFPINIGSITKGTSRTFNYNFTVPASTLPGAYNSILRVAATSASAFDIVYNTTVNSITTWNSSLDLVTSFTKTNTPGICNRLTINNTGNNDQTYTLQYTGVSGILNNPPTSVSISRQTVQTITFNCLGMAAQGTYPVNVYVTGSVAGSQTKSFSVVVEDVPPTISISSPTTNQDVSGSWAFTVSVNDNQGVDRVEFYVNTNLVNTTYTGAGTVAYQWNTSLYAEGPMFIKSVAYDMAGNLNSANVTCNVDNIDENPLIISSLLPLTIPEDSYNNTVNLTTIFRSNDNDVLSYSATKQNNSNLTIDPIPASSMVNITPNPNFYGSETVYFNATDPTAHSSQVGMLVIISPVNDAPITPVLTAPASGVLIRQDSGSITFNWTSTDADPTDTITYRVYFSSTNPPVYYTTTTNKHMLVDVSTLQNATTYYWRVAANDGIVWSANSTTYNFTFYDDNAPTITSVTPVSTMLNVQENSTNVFNVTSHDSEGQAMNHTWRLDNAVVQTNSGVTNSVYTYIPDFNSTGTHTLTCEVNDENNNKVSVSWQIMVTDLNRQPVLGSLPALPSDIVEGTTIGPFNVTAADPDVQFGDRLTYSTTHGTITPVINDTTKATYSWTTTGWDVGLKNVTITVSDLNNAKSSQSFIINITNINSAPGITVHNITTEEEKLVAFGLNGTDADIGVDLYETAAGLKYNKSVQFGVLNTMGTFSWKPTGADVGVHKITFCITDYYNVSSCADVWITVIDANNAPQLKPINPQSGTQGYFVSFNISAEDLDLTQAGDNLTFSCDKPNAAITKTSATTANIVWVPGPLDVGTNRIIFTVTDSQGLSDSDTATITVGNINDPPTVLSTVPASLTPAIPDSYTTMFKAVVIDYDNDPITYKWYIDGAEQQETSSSLSYNAAAGSSYHTIKLELSDSYGAKNSTIWQVTVAEKPVATTFDGSTTNFNNIADLSNANNVVLEKSSYGKIEFTQPLDLSNVVDFNNCIMLGQSIVGVDTTCLPQLQNKAARITLKHLSYNTVPVIYYNSGFTSNASEVTTACSFCTLVSYTPPATTDGTVVFDIEHFTVFTAGNNQSNQAPIITSTPVTSIVKETMYTYDVNAIDADQDNITYSLVTSPPAMAINSSTGLIQWQVPDMIGGYSVTVQASDGVLSSTQTFFVNIVYPSMLEISNIDVTIDGDSESISGGETNDELKPGSELEFEIEVTNNFAEDVKIEDIKVNILIEGIDEGDDLDDKSDKFDLRDGDDDTVDFEFSIPYNLGEGQYKATVKAEGSVKTQKFTDNVEFYFEVEKEKHDVVLQKAQFVSPTVECSRNTAIEIKVLNLGNTDEDEVKLDVTSTELGISEKAKFDLDEATGDDGDDYDYAKSIPLEIKEELKAGKYPVSITVYYENSRVADSKIITLNVADCEEKSGKTEIVSAHQPGSVEQAVSTIAGKGSQDDRVVESRFRDSSLYTTLLISGGIILLGAVIFAAGAVIILSKKGKL